MKHSLKDASNGGGNTSLELFSPGAEGEPLNQMEFGSFDADIASDNEDLLLGDVFADLLGDDGDDPFAQDMLDGDLLIPAPNPAIRPGADSTSTRSGTTSSRKGVQFPKVFRRAQESMSYDPEAETLLRKQEPPKIFNKSKRQIELLKAEGYRMFATEDWFQGKDMSWLFVGGVAESVSSPLSLKPQFFKGKSDDSSLFLPEGSSIDIDGAVSPKPKKAVKAKSAGTYEDDLMKEDVDASLDLLGLIKPKKSSKKSVPKLTNSGSATNLDDIALKDGLKVAESQDDISANNLSVGGASTALPPPPGISKGKSGADSSKLLSSTLKPKSPFRVPFKSRGTKNLQLYLQLYMKSLNGRSNSIERLKTDNGIPPSKQMPAAASSQRQQQEHDIDEIGITLRRIVASGANFGSQYPAVVGAQSNVHRDTKVISCSAFDPKGLISDPVSMYLLYASTQGEVANAVVQSSSLHNPRSCRAIDMASRKRAVLTSFDDMCKKSRDAKKIDSKSPLSESKTPLELAASQGIVINDEKSSAVSVVGSNDSSAEAAGKQPDAPFLKNANLPGSHSVELVMAMYSGYNLVSSFGDVLPDLASTRDMYNPIHPNVFSAAEARRSQMNMSKIHSFDATNHTNKSTCLFEGFENTRLGMNPYRTGLNMVSEPQKPIINNATKRAKAVPKAQQMASLAALSGGRGQAPRASADGSLSKPMMEGSRLLTAIANANTAANLAKRSLGQVSSIDGSSNLGPEAKIQRLSPTPDAQIGSSQGGTAGGLIAQQQVSAGYNIHLSAIAAASAQQRAGMPGMTPETAALARARAIQAAQASRIMQMQMQSNAASSVQGLPGAAAATAQQGGLTSGGSMVLPSLPPASGTSAPWMQTSSSVNFVPANASTLIPASGNMTASSAVGAAGPANNQLSAAVYAAQLQAHNQQRALLGAAGDKQAGRVLIAGNNAAATRAASSAATSRISSMKDVLTAPFLSTLADKTAFVASSMGQAKTLPVQSQQQNHLQQMQLQMQMQYVASQQHAAAAAASASSSKHQPSSSFPQMPGLSAAVAAAPTMMVAAQLPLNLPSNPTLGVSSGMSAPTQPSQTSNPNLRRSN
jgi:hypothetical protein